VLPATSVDGQRIPTTNRGVKLALRRATARRLKCALIERGWTVTDLARKARLTRNYTSLTVHGHRGSEAARRRIAKVLGMDMERAFPKVEVEVKVESGRRGEIPRCARNDRGKGEE